MVHVNYKANLLYILIIIASIFYAPICLGENSSDFILFPHGNAIFRSDIADNSTLDDDDYEYGVDLFATFEYGNFRILGEYLLAKKEQSLERIQIGWLFGDSKIWLGRYHTPIGYWNTQYHHGSFLETGISRPEIVKFEDDTGPLPMHTAGLLIEGELKRGEQGLGYNFSIGAGPDFTGELEAWDLLNPRSGKHDISTTLNLYFDPVLYAQTRYGLFVNYTKIPADTIGFNEIHQISSGIYGNWVSRPWRLMGSSFYVHNRLKQSNRSLDEDFFSSYIQAEYNPSDKWILYGRVELTTGDEDDAYLSLFPEFVKERIMGGIRLNILHHNALKLEFSRNHTIDDDFGQFMLQWDAVF